MITVQIRSYFWSVFSPNRGKYGPEKTSYLDTFHGEPCQTSMTENEIEKHLISRAALGGCFQQTNF